MDEARSNLEDESVKNILTEAGKADPAVPPADGLEKKRGIGEGADGKKLGEILVERGVLKPKELQKLLSAQKPLGQILVESGLGTPEVVEAALAEQQRLRGAQKERQKAEEAASIRISAEKLDSLVDLVGELITVQALLSQTALSHDIPEIRSVAEQVERLSADLHDKTMDIRMLVWSKYSSAPFYMIF
jgi:two-component system chemotaxis sensor kinase CheA